MNDVYIMENLENRVTMLEEKLASVPLIYNTTHPDVRPTLRDPYPDVEAYVSWSYPFDDNTVIDFVWKDDKIIAKIYRRKLEVFSLLSYFF